VCPIRATLHLQHSICNTPFATLHFVAHLSRGSARCLQEPYILHLTSLSSTKGVVYFAKKSPVCCQKSSFDILPKGARLRVIKSPEFHLIIPLFYQKSPVFSQKSPICCQKTLYPVKRVLHSTTRARYSAKRAPCTLSKESCMLLKEPYSLTKDLYSTKRA